MGAEHAESAERFLARRRLHAQRSRTPFFENPLGTGSIRDASHFVPRAVQNQKRGSLCDELVPRAEPFRAFRVVRAHLQLRPFTEVSDPRHTSPAPIVIFLAARERHLSPIIAPSAVASTAPAICSRQSYTSTGAISNEHPRTERCSTAVAFAVHPCPRRRRRRGACRERPSLADIDGHRRRTGHRR